MRKLSLPEGPVGVNDEVGSLSLRFVGSAERFK